MGKHLSDVDDVVTTALTGGHTDPHTVVVRLQDVGLVAGRVHQACVGLGERPGVGDVLAGATTDRTILITTPRCIVTDRLNGRGPRSTACNRQPKLYET